MNLDFSDDHKMIRNETARFLEKQCPSAIVRRVLEGDERYAQSLWHGLGELGLTATHIPEEYGGVGAGYLPLCLIAEELGASLAPTPFPSTIYLVADALMLAGTQAQQSTFLPEIAAGKLIGALAVVESLGEPDENGIKSEVANGVLSGKKLVVPDGGIADIAIVAARDPSGGISLYIADLHHDSVSRKDQASVDPTRNIASLDFDRTPVERLGEAGAGWKVLEDLYNRAAVLFAFEQVGGARRALNMAVEYAKDRYSFGRPIGSFQAIKHLLADTYTAVALAESNCYYAAWALSSNAPELPLAAATARLSATDAFIQSTVNSIQVHGGMGFTWEFDCHLYYRRSNFLAGILGGSTVWEERLVSNIC